METLEVELLLVSTKVVRWSKILTDPPERTSIEGTPRQDVLLISFVERFIGFRRQYSFLPENWKNVSQTTEKVLTSFPVINSNLEGLCIAKGFYTVSKSN